MRPGRPSLESAGGLPILKLQDRPVAARYARALFGAARAQKVVEPVRGDLAAIAEALRRVPALGAALGLPRLPPAAKLDLLVQVLDAASPLTRSFLALLLEKKRWDALGDVLSVYGRLADEAARVLRARAASAFALTENEQEAIRRRLEKAWGGTVALEAVTEEALLGGLTLRVGDRVWDHSLRRQLDRLRDRLVDGAAV